MKISPYMLGSGKAAAAIVEALRIIEVNHDIEVGPVQKIKRNSPIPDVTNISYPVLFIANPHALHAKAILEGEKAGFKLIVTEKPAATSLEQIEKLKQVKIPVAVCHGYRQMWGIQTIKEMFEREELGELISLEGRYWQSSAAERAVSGKKSDSWKNDTDLSGPADVVFDLATHWLDAAIFIAGKPHDITLWRSFKNGEAAHRDTHVHLNLGFTNSARGMCSVSKTVHGAGNHFEINFIGTKKHATWKFAEPDILELSEGSMRSYISRKRTDIGSGHNPHHGMGWLEGYIEIILQALKGGSYPTLHESLFGSSLLLAEMRVSGQ